MLNTDYHIGDAFQAIENELISSMIRNMRTHRVSEETEGITWGQWQVLQLQALERYKVHNAAKYRGQFRGLNRQIGEAIRQANALGGMEEEIRILDAIRKGFKGANPVSASLQGEFFRLNTRKLDALIGATKQDMQKAETAILRMANDRYRKIIYNAQMYANSGVGTYEKAVDMATKDMLSSGLNCIQYKNGARHTLASYSRMAIRTASKRAYLQGEGVKRQEWGIATVILNKRGNACPLCAPFVGKILIDDVWSGGKVKDGPYPLMSTAIAAGLYHPNCKDSHTTYFPGISTAEDTWTKAELEKIGVDYNAEQKANYAAKQAEKYERLANYSLDPENHQMYDFKEKYWKRVYFKTGGINSNKYADQKNLFESVKKTFNPACLTDVVRLLRRDSESWVANLTEKQMKSIHKYTFNGREKDRFFKVLNSALRKGEELTPAQRFHSGNISSALQMCTIARDIVVYRGTDDFPWFDLDIGDPFRMSQFVSTSVIPSLSYERKYQIDIWIRKGTSGVGYIESMSHFPKQREVLIDRDCMFRILSKQGTKMILEVIK